MVGNIDITAWFLCVACCYALIGFTWRNYCSMRVNFITLLLFFFYQLPNQWEFKDSERETENILYSIFLWLQIKGGRFILWKKIPFQRSTAINKVPLLMKLWKRYTFGNWFFKTLSLSLSLLCLVFTAFPMSHSAVIGERAPGFADLI